jgi:aspartyl/asparaginyl-tRNA synthetase
MFVATIRNEVTKVDYSDYFLFYLHGRGISKVEIVGWIKAVEIRAKKVVYIIDDGTSPSIRCTKYLNSNDTHTHIPYSTDDLVSAKGILALSETNDEPYGFNIHLTSIEVVEDPNAEAFHWLSAIQLYRDEYVT